MATRCMPSVLVTLTWAVVANGARRSFCDGGVDGFTSVFVDEFDKGETKQCNACTITFRTCHTIVQRTLLCCSGVAALWQWTAAVVLVVAVASVVVVAME